MLRIVHCESDGVRILFCCCAKGKNVTKGVGLGGNRMGRVCGVGVGRVGGMRGRLRCECGYFC